MHKKTIHSNEYSRLVEMLTSERKRLGLSQSEVAIAIDLTQSDVSKLENQERRMDVLEFKRIIHLYRVSENPRFYCQILNFFGLSNDEG
ncbi:MAG: XRE family transcriptional regulator [Candidatus Methylumidiphilus alinenensis]|uniref:XRE family transcriptional regulator n=1 Tax=Candidatus Methylumidiphilus alinenensis TaxID=2202197 RepID=A0A2W4QGW5_9GAMM|nr:MAG: XRE family transcriptional regulator [Candidatus Methylumidiphilus alinenensis]